jgi:hypothetical protein
VFTGRGRGRGAKEQRRGEGLTNIFFSAKKLTFFLKKD